MAWNLQPLLPLLGLLIALALRPNRRRSAWLILLPFLLLYGWLYVHNLGRNEHTDVAMFPLAMFWQWVWLAGVLLLAPYLTGVGRFRGILRLILLTALIPAVGFECSRAGDGSFQTMTALLGDVGMFFGLVAVVLTSLALARFVCRKRFTRLRFNLAYLVATQVLTIILIVAYPYSSGGPLTYWTTNLIRRYGVPGLLLLAAYLVWKRYRTRGIPVRARAPLVVGAALLGIVLNYYAIVLLGLLGLFLVSQRRKRGVPLRSSRYLLVGLAVVAIALDVFLASYARHLHVPGVSGLRHALSAIFTPVGSLMSIDTILRMLDVPRYVFSLADRVFYSWGTCPGNYILNLPFLIVAFAGALYYERFRALLHIRDVPPDSDSST